AFLLPTVVCSALPSYLTPQNAPGNLNSSSFTTTNGASINYHMWVQSAGSSGEQGWLDKTSNTTWSTNFTGIAANNKGAGSFSGNVFTSSKTGQINIVGTDTVDPAS